MKLSHLLRRSAVSLCLLCALGSLPAQASHIERLSDSPDADTIIAGAEASFRSELENFVHFAGEENMPGLADLDWNTLPAEDCYKIYSDKGGKLLRFSGSFDELKDSLSCRYCFPITSYTHSTIHMTLKYDESDDSSGLFASYGFADEEGKWKVDSFSTAEVPTAEELEKDLPLGEKDTEILYFDVLSNEKIRLAAAENEDGSISVLFPDESDTLSDAGLKPGTVYSLADVQAALGSPAEDAYADDSTAAVMAVIIIAVFAAIPLTLRLRRRKKQS